MLPVVQEIVLVSNMQSTGPMFISDATGSIPLEKGMLLAARLIITAGIGNMSTKTQEIFGPLPLPELEGEDFICYLMTEDMMQIPLPESSFSTGKGTLMYCIIFKKRFQDGMGYYQKIIQSILKKFAGKIDFSESVTGMINPSIIKNAHSVLNQLLTEINETIENIDKYKGGSLFHLGFLASLPDELSALAKKLIQQPNGWKDEEFSDNELIRILILAQLLVKEERNGEYWLVPQ